MKKKIAVAVSLLLVLALSIGGTIAWLTDTSDTVVNTFTVGKVELKLEETGANKDGTTELFKKDYAIVPGATLAKDPTITVSANSEKCYVFVRITEANNSITVGSATQDIVQWNNLSGWNQAYAADDGSEYVYWKEVAKATTATTLQVLTGGTETNQTGQVTINDNLTAENTPTTAPTLTFKAAAIQADNIQKTDVWAALPSAFTNGITSITMS